MNHLYLATAAAQHATKWHPSAAEVSNIRIAGIVLLVLCLFGLYRTATKPGRDARAAAAARPAVEARRVAAHTTYDSAE